jgi:RNA polymerase sigma-70 factor (ECF subfamily)
VRLVPGLPPEGADGVTGLDAIALRLLPYLLVAARNSWISRRRQAIYDLDRARELRLWSDRVPAPPSPHEEAVGQQTRRAAEAALLDLPLPLREALLLVAALGLEPSEAAGILDISPENLRQRLSRARARLAERLEREP